MRRNIQGHRDLLYAGEDGGRVRMRQPERSALPGTAINVYALTPGALRGRPADSPWLEGVVAAMRGGGGRRSDGAGYPSQPGRLQLARTQVRLGRGVSFFGLVPLRVRSQLGKLGCFHSGTCLPHAFLCIPPISLLRWAPHHPSCPHILRT